MINVLYVEENQDGTTGGSHYCLLDLVEVLSRDKFNPIVMFYENNRAVPDFQRSGVRVIIFPKPRAISIIKILENGPLRFITKYPFLLRPIQVIINILITNLYPILFFIYFIMLNDIRIIHLNNSVFTGLEWLIAAKITGRKIIAHQRSYFEGFPKIYVYHSRFFDHILGISNSTKEFLHKYGVKLDKYTTFYDRIDINKFRSNVTVSRDAVREEFSITKEQPLIGIVGNLQRWKGQMTVVEAVHLLKDRYPGLRCLLVGDSSKIAKDDVQYYDELISKIKAYSLRENIIITGFRTDVANLLNAMDIFIHASIRPEPWGLVVLEAMAMGKAIIASNDGGPVEMIVNGESGYLVEPGKPETLAEKLDLLLADPSLRRDMGQNALNQMQEKFSNIDIAFIENLYQDLIRR